MPLLVLSPEHKRHLQLLSSVDEEGTTPVALLPLTFFLASFSGPL